MAMNKISKTPSSKFHLFKNIAISLWIIAMFISGFIYLNGGEESEIIPHLFSGSIILSVLALVIASTISKRRMLQYIYLVGANVFIGPAFYYFGVKQFFISQSAVAMMANPILSALAFVLAVISIFLFFHMEVRYSQKKEEHREMLFIG